MELSYDVKNPLAGKISKIIEFDTEADESFFESLQVVSTSHTSHDERSCRSLRGMMERSRLELAERFLREMSALKTGLDSLSAELGAMSKSCSRINDRLMSSKCRMEELVDEANATQTQKNTLALTRLAASALLSAFHIPEEDWAVLDEPFNDGNAEDLLARLARAKRIREVIVNTMGLPNLPLVKDIVDSSTAYVDRAFERLYQWIKKEVSTQDLEAVEMSVALRRGLGELEERPIFFKYVLDEYANTRRRLVVEAFVEALTKGWKDAEGSAFVVSRKPIEMQSHDPARYAGDMLAWLHQAVASEKEYLRSLASERADKEMMCDCLNSISSGLAHPLQLRLEQILVTEHDALLLYNINNLLQFYASVVLNLVDERSTVYVTLSELQKLSWDLFVSALQHQTSELLADVEVTHRDLMPSMSSIEVTRLLEAILTTHDMSCLPPDVRQTKCEEIVEVVVKRLMEHYECMARRFTTSEESRRAETKTNLKEEEDEGRDLGPVALVYLLNSLHSLHGTLARLAYTGTQITVVVERLETVLTYLTRVQAAHILARAGLYHLYAALDVKEKGRDGEAIEPGQRKGFNCSQDDIIDALREFNTVYLSNPDAWELVEVGQIAFSRPRNALRRRTADLVHSLYARVYEAIMDENSGYTNPWPEDIKTPEQVADLLLPSFPPSGAPTA